MQRIHSAGHGAVLRPGIVSMFFRRGQSDLPSPLLGAQAGIALPGPPWGLALALSAVGLPILGVVAVAKSVGLDALAGRWAGGLRLYSRCWSTFPSARAGHFPRTASTSFEMAVTPFPVRARVGAAGIRAGVFRRCHGAGPAPRTS